MIDACEGSQYIVHTASPFSMQMPKDENELIKPAVEGTLAVMKAAQKYKVKKVVITSSVSAVGDGLPDDHLTYTEEDWTNIEDESV